MYFSYVCFFLGLFAMLRYFILLYYFLLFSENTVSTKRDNLNGQKVNQLLDDDDDDDDGSKVFLR